MKALILTAESSHATAPLEPLDGEPAVEHSLRPLEQIPEIDDITIAVPEEAQSPYLDWFRRRAKGAETLRLVRCPQADGRAVAPQLRLLLRESHLERRPESFVVCSAPLTVDFDHLACVQECRRRRISIVATVPTLDVRVPSTLLPFAVLRPECVRPVLSLLEASPRPVSLVELLERLSETLRPGSLAVLTAPHREA